MVQHVPTLDFAFHERHECVVNADYRAVLDEYRHADARQMLVAHIVFHRFTPRVFANFLREWRAFRALCPAPIFAFPLDDDGKWAHFVTRLGFRFVCSIPFTDGVTRRIFVSFPDEGNHARTEEPTAAAADLTDDEPVGTAGWLSN